MLEAYSNYAEHAVFHQQHAKKIAIALLGGTLLSIEDPVTGRRPAASGEELVEKTPKLKLVQSRLATLDIFKIMSSDSADMVAEDWTTTVNEIAKLVPKYHGILAIMGTDTTDRVGTALTFGLRGLAAFRKNRAYLTTPISLGTSQKPLVDFGSDAETQIQDGLSAVIVGSDLRVSEVMIPSGRTRVVRACRASKISEEKFDIHNSPNYPPVANIVAAEEMFKDVQFTRYAELIRNIDDILDQSTEPTVQSNFVGGIESIALNGLGTVNSRLALVEAPSCTGLVIYTHGAGNGPFTNPERTIVPVIKRATELGKPVLLTTSIYGGKVNPYLYEAGRKMADVGGIGTFDMTPAAAEVKLSWSMGLPEFTTGGVNFIREIFNRDLVGEKGNPDLVIK